MTSALNLARLAAVVALFGFFLPWAEVSCSGEPLMHETGIQLITGVGAAAGPMHHDLWVAATLGLVGLGLVGSFLLRGQRGALVLMAAAAAAAVASLIGVSQEVPSAEVQAQLTASPGGSAGQGGFLGAKLEYGYFVTLGGLIAAIAAAGLALAGRTSAGTEP
jgi:hypothetical protein